MINKELFEGPVGDYCIARNTIKCLLSKNLMLSDWLCVMCVTCLYVSGCRQAAPASGGGRGWYPAHPGNPLESPSPHAQRGNTKHILYT